MNHCLIFNFNVDEGYARRSAGGHRIANHLRNQNWDAEVIDFTTSWSHEQLIELFKSRLSKNSKFIGISLVFSASCKHPTLEFIAKYIKENYPQLLVISGGQAVVDDSAYVDYHVAGYGEGAIDAILKYHFANGDKPILSAKYFGRKTKVIDALHAYPYAPCSNPMLDYEKRDFMHHNEFARIEFARGCKFSCIYCNYPILGVKGDATRDAEGARLQLQQTYDKWGITCYDVADETFNDTTEKITKFANVVETLTFKPWFKGFIRADLLVSRPMDREELLRMGFLGQFYGVETFNPKSAKAIKKGMNPQRLQEGLLEVKDYFKNHVGKNFRAEMALIAGLPHETKETLETTKQWVKKNWLDQCVNAQPLHIIPDDSYRTSSLSTTYAGYGYDIMGRKDISGKDFFHHGDTQSPYLWKNEHMDIYDANDWAKSIYDLFKIGNHSIAKLDLGNLENVMENENGELLTLSKRLALTDKNSRLYYKEKTFIQNYIQKKLSV